MKKQKINLATLFALSIMSMGAHANEIFMINDMMVGSNQVVSQDVFNKGTATGDLESFNDPNRILNFSVNKLDDSSDQNLAITTRVIKTPIFNYVVGADGSQTPIESGLFEKTVDINIKTADDIKLNSTTTNLSTSNTFSTTGGKVTINDTQSNFGNTIINGVADGLVSADSTQAINGSQLYNVLQNVSGSQSKSVIGGSNISVTNTDNVSAVNLNDTINIQSVTIGTNRANTTASTMNRGAITLETNNVDFGGNKIKNVQHGTVAHGSSEAVTGHQVADVLYSVANIVGGATHLSDSKTEVKNGYVALTKPLLDGTSLYNIADSLEYLNKKGYSLSIGENQVGTPQDEKVLYQLGNKSDINFVAGKNIVSKLTHEVTGSNDYGCPSISFRNATSISGESWCKAASHSSIVSYELADDIDVKSVNAQNQITIGDKSVTINNSGIDLKGGDIIGMNTIDDINLTSNDKKGVNVETLRNALKNQKDSLVEQQPNGDITIGAKVGGTYITVSNKDGEPRTIGGVKDAAKDDEAVNLGQMNRGLNSLETKIKDVDDNARSGIAGVAASAALPQVFEYGKNLIAVGVGHHRGKQAVAAGFSATTDNGRHIVKLQGSVGLQDRKSATVGAGYGFMW